MFSLPKKFTVFDTFGSLLLGALSCFALATLGGVNYCINEEPSGIALIAPNASSGLTTIQGSVSTIPESASLLLLSAGLIGLRLSEKALRSRNKARTNTR